MSLHFRLLVPLALVFSGGVQSTSAQETQDVASLNKQVIRLHGEGKYEQAIPIAKKVLDINEKMLGPEHPDTAKTLNKLAVLYLRISDYATAEPLHQRALKIQEKVLGPEHPDTAGSLNNLAELYRSMGDSAKAEPLYLRALKIWEQVLGPEHPNTAKSLNNLAILYDDSMGDYARAEPLYQRALKIWEQALGPEHPTTAKILSNLADLYRSMGDYARAEPLYQRALKILEKVLGPDHPHTASSLSVLAELYGRMGDNARAEPLHQRALKIREKVLGPEDPHTATSLGNLASLYTRMGDYAKAEPLLQRALKIQEKVLGPDHPHTASSLSVLGSLYERMGDYAKAEPLHQRALRMREKVLGPEHPDTARSLNNLGLLFVDLGRKGTALEMFAKVQRAELQTLANILSFASEQQRLAYQAKKADPYHLFGTLGDAPGIARSLLGRKGIVLDSLLEDRSVARASEVPEHRAQIDQLRFAKQRLSKFLFDVPKDYSQQALEARHKEREKLSKEVEQLEGDLARQVAGLGRARLALSVTVEQVQATLPNDAVLIEFLGYPHYLGTNRWEARYGAILLASSGDPKWIPLGPAAQIEKEVLNYQETVRGRMAEKDLLRLCQSLYSRVWLPLATGLPAGTKQIIISPDGLLNFVAFGTLVTEDDQFLAEKFSISYVASGRDLLREFKVSTNAELVIFANPDFGRRGSPGTTNLTTTATLALRALDRGDLQGLRLPPLPGTATESKSLTERARSWGWSVRSFAGEQSTEEALQAAPSPFILHLATHGFFLPEATDGASGDVTHLRGIGRWQPMGGFVSAAGDELGFGQGVALKNPMHRSGLALAGAQATLEAWKRGEVPPTANDGIVTAEEVGGLNLQGTWLVVLSACDTGVGEARAGEGVLGLRRGFVQAGAQNLLMTLWPVADEETAQFVVDFYEAGHKTGNAPKALADVQRDWLVKLRKKRGLTEAVRIAGPFILSSQGAIR